jgi:uncharacterized phage protein (TIGR02220 family)
MAIIKNKSKNNFTIISNSILRDKNLTMAEKGLLCYLISLPDNFIIHKTNLVNSFANGYDAISTVFDELCKKGFIEVTMIANNGGVGIDFEYNIYTECQNKIFLTVGEVKNLSSIPIREIPISENPISENPILEFPILENPILLNTNLNLNNNIVEERRYFNKANSPVGVVETKKQIAINILNYLGNKNKVNYGVVRNGQKVFGKKHMELIFARLKDGYDYDDFVKVIDFKYKDWINTNFEMYIRPETLFNKSKFECYLIEALNKIEKNNKTNNSQKNLTQKQIEIYNKIKQNK